jgi:hypothetical protein
MYLLSVGQELSRRRAYGLTVVSVLEKKGSPFPLKEFRTDSPAG